MARNKVTLASLLWSCLPRLISQALFIDGLVVAGRWYKPMLAKLDNSSPSATMYFYAVRSFRYGDFGPLSPGRINLSPEEEIGAARDVLGGR
jgi:hypothetical protein